ncbi:glycosyltransferase family 9 protein [bacterium]|nr:glycosyltransferase family 9 protein [bacterium]
MDSTTHDVVIVRLDAVGDFILSIPLLQAIRKHFRAQKITMIVSSAVADLVKQLDLADNIDAVDIANYHGPYSLVWQLIKDKFRFRRWRANKVIVAAHARTLFADNIALSIRSPLHVAMSGNADNYQHRINRLPGLSYEAVSRRYQTLFFVDRGHHSLVVNSEFSKYLTGVKLNLKYPFLREIFLGESEKSIKNAVVIAPGAGDIRRVWPVAKWDELLGHAQCNVPFIIVGSSADKEVGDHVMQALKRTGKVAYNLVGTTSLIDLIRIIKNATVVIGNESAPIHIAAGLGVPSISITGGGHFGAFVPYPPVESAPLVAYKSMACFNCNWMCRYNLASNESYPCVSQIEVADVANLVTSILENSQG